MERHAQRTVEVYLIRTEEWYRGRAAERGRRKEVKTSSVGEQSKVHVKIEDT